jgi:hypothetical protein
VLERDRNSYYTLLGHDNEGFMRPGSRIRGPGEADSGVETAKSLGFEAWNPGLTWRAHVPSAHDAEQSQVAPRDWELVSRRLSSCRHSPGWLLGGRACLARGMVAAVHRAVGAHPHDERL